MPERHVFQGGQGVAAQDAGQTGDAFAGDGVALVGHGRGAFLAGVEIFFRFPDVGALQVADLGGEFVEGAADDRQRRQKFGVPVALDDLGGQPGGFQAHLLADVGFDPGIDVGIGADRAGQFADGDDVAGPFQALDVAFGFVHPQGEFQAEGQRLRMDAVGPADHDGVFVFGGAAFQDRVEFFEVVEEDAGGLLHHDAERGVFHVAGGQAKMNVFGFVADVFGHRRQERQDVMAGFLLDFADARHGELGFRLDDRHGLGRDLAQLGHDFAGADLDVEHGLELVLVGPDPAHFRIGVTFNHWAAPPLHFSRCLISRATITPDTEACANPRVTPAPSPTAKKFGILVSSKLVRCSREE